MISLLGEGFFRLLTIWFNYDSVGCIEVINLSLMQLHYLCLSGFVNKHIGGSLHWRGGTVFKLVLEPISSYGGSAPASTCQRSLRTVFGFNYSCYDNPITINGTTNYCANKVATQVNVNENILLYEYDQIWISWFWCHDKILPT